MAIARIQAFASRYTATLIENAPPNEADLASQGFTQEEPEAVYRMLNQIQKRLLVEAQVMESL